MSVSQEAKTIVSPASIKVGEEALLTYSIELPKGATYKHIPFGTILPARLKNPGGSVSGELSSNIEQIGTPIDTVIQKGNVKIWKMTYSISGWDEGNYTISGARLQVGDSMVNFPDVDLKVSLVAEKKGQDIYDIRESYADLPEPPNPVVLFFKENQSWLVPVLIILGLGLLLLFLWYRSNKKPAAAPPIPSLKERSLLAIDALEKQRLWEQGKLKEHYIELSYILRSYLSSRYLLNILENTTSEAQLLLKAKGLHHETIQTIGRVLDQSDMVKFAKSAPDEIEILKISQLVRQIIAETSPLDFDNNE